MIFQSRKVPLHFQFYHPQHILYSTYIICLKRNKLTRSIQDADISTDKLEEMYRGDVESVLIVHTARRLQRGPDLPGRR